MLYRHNDFEETLVHQCSDADRYTKAHKQEMANVRVHDVSAYLSVPIKDYKHIEQDVKKPRYPIIGHETVRITHCPYCGVELEKDEQTGKFLDLDLL